MCSQMKFVNENIHRYFQMYFKYVSKIFSNVSQKYYSNMIFMKYMMNENIYS